MQATKNEIIDEPPLRILDVPGFDLADFEQRWERARSSAIGSVDHKFTTLQNASPAEVEGILRKVFDNSRALGISASKFMGASWELSDLKDILPSSGIPCLSGECETRQFSMTIRREPCAQGQACKHICDFYREAIDGLVMGLCEDERYARQASGGHGDGRCVDVFFLENGNAEIGARELYRYESVSPELLQSLAPVAERLERMHAHIVFKGVAEQTLYYEIVDSKNGSCGATGRILHGTVERLVHEINPSLRIQDTAPLAVYGEKA